MHEMQEVAGGDGGAPIQSYTSMGSAARSYVALLIGLLLHRESPKYPRFLVGTPQP